VVHCLSSERRPSWLHPVTWTQRMEYSIRSHKLGSITQMGWECFDAKTWSLPDPRLTVYTEGLSEASLWLVGGLVPRAVAPGGLKQAWVCSRDWTLSELGTHHWSPRQDRPPCRKPVFTSWDWHLALAQKLETALGNQHWASICIQSHSSLPSAPRCHTLAKGSNTAKLPHPLWLWLFLPHCPLRGAILDRTWVLKS
jgi:hypothetical protein